MKNKLFNKRFSKILVTMCLLLAMVFGSCMSVSASSSSGNLYLSKISAPSNSGCIYRNLQGTSVVYSVSYTYLDRKGIGLFSSSPFSLESYEFINSAQVPVPSSYSLFNVNSNKLSSSQPLYFYRREVSSLDYNFVGDIDYNITLPINYTNDNELFKVFSYILGYTSNLADGIIIEGGSDIPTNPEYDSGATATIAPPSGVTYYEYVDTSQTSVTSPTVRIGQLQWNVPDDDTLYIEIYADLTYKEGLLNKKTQVVYPWKTLSNSGLKADINKISFERFQAGTDYFIENGLDESSFSSHVVNGYYLRFCRINDDKSVSYSLWNKISILRDNSLTQIGTATSETGIFDENGNWVNKQIVNSEIVDGGGKHPAFSPGLDDDGNNLPSNNNGLDLDSLLTDSNIFERFIGYLKSAISSLGELPQYVGQLFSFLPQEIIGLLGFGVIIAIILRIIGR